MTKKIRFIILTSILIIAGVALIYGFTSEQQKSTSKKTKTQETNDVTPPIAQPPQE
jgi:hypothetical protein